MSLKIKISILLTVLEIISSTFLHAELNYLKPKAERNNVVNKRVWVRNNKDRSAEHSNAKDFIFRANSLDVDNILQNNFDAFGENGMENSPGIFEYMRSKRSMDEETKKLLQKNLKECKGDDDCTHKVIHDKAYMKSKLISNLKPTSVFNDYPYEVAILLGDNRLDIVNRIRKENESGNLQSVIPLNANLDANKLSIESLANTEYKTDKIKINDTNNTVVAPKRSMNKEYNREVLTKIEIIEESKDNGTAKFDRGILDKDEGVWPQNVPDGMYKVAPKHPKSKLINERGLIKVLSMLTKTFKKIMKQHNDIRKIHSKLHHINDEVNRNMVDMGAKYQDIEEKYGAILTMHNKMKDFEVNMNMKEEYFRAKEKEMGSNLAEFENQQKKFLSQQRQFYNIQKLMLAQNERINIKQNLIAKTQSEISHRQNNFARILKKAKQIYIDNKYTTSKVAVTTMAPINETEEVASITHTTTSAPYTTESIKINLFSIPTLSKLPNQDIQILKEKDEQPVDDLVYKYYFNNTFIDNLMKSKILSTFVTTAENTEITRNAKNKRNNHELRNTLLLPINDHNKTETASKLKRERRWIRHHHQSKAKLKKLTKNHIPNQFDDGKPIKPKTDDNLNIQDGKTVTKLFSKDQNSPFLVMAKSFCNEIGHNVNDQMLNWCVEKSLRRLQFIDSKVPLFSPDPLVTSPVQEQKTTTLLASSKVTYAPVPVSFAGSSSDPVTVPSTPLTVAPVLLTQATHADLIYFPDNDELESNLKEFDLKPDPEGNFYYDGSLHASDLAGIVENSDGFSDMMPGLDSNSRVDVDPIAFDLQAKRRANVRRINANLLKKLYG